MTMTATACLCTNRGRHAHDLLGIDHEWLSCAMDHFITDFIDRYFVSEPTADSLRAIMLLAAFAQGFIVISGVVLLWHAIGCGLSQHHGHSIVCTVGVVIAIASFEIASQTWKRAQAARKEAVRQ